MQLLLGYGNIPTTSGVIFQRYIQPSNGDMLDGCITSARNGTEIDMHYTSMKTKVTRKECPWTCLGENTGGFVWWCEKCGATEDEDGRNFQTPYSIDFDTLYCPDQGLVP